MILPSEDPAAYVSKYVVALKDAASGLENGEFYLNVTLFVLKLDVVR